MATIPLLYSHKHQHSLSSLAQSQRQCKGLELHSQLWHICMLRQEPLFSFQTPKAWVVIRPSPVWPIVCFYVLSLFHMSFFIPYVFLLVLEHSMTCTASNSIPSQTLFAQPQTLSHLKLYLHSPAACHSWHRLRTTTICQPVAMSTPPHAS
jgi:hypothetical protein